MNVGEYQFAFAHSGWRHACVVLGGESFQALTSGLQDALWMAGGVPEEHRTDSLSAAFNNLAEQEKLTRRYRELCAHYGLRASRNNLGVSHENGAIESRQGSLKRALDQALLLRGTREFADLPAYQQFVAETARRLNARCARAWEVERASLKPLPERRTSDYEELDARVSKFGVFSAKSALYSVPSRLVDHRLKVRLYSAHIEAWLGGVKVFECERLYGSVEERHPKRIDWRHMLPWLKRKPGAFARWALRDAMFPRSEYAQAWERINERLPERAACRLMVELLDLADQANVVVELAGALSALHERGEGITAPGPLAPFLNVPMVELTGERFADWYRVEMLTRKTRATQAFRAVRAFIHWAADMPEYAEIANADVYRARAIRDLVPTKNNAKDDCLQREQLPTWFEHVKRIANQVISAYLQSLLLTGARRDELVTLRWEDVDFQWLSLRISDKVNGERTIPLTPYVASLLLKLKASNDTPPNVRQIRRLDRQGKPEWKPSPWVFSSITAAKGRIVNAGKAHTAAVAAAGLPHLTLHGLRRSFGTLSEWCECPVGVVAQIMGHAPSAIAEKHYRRRPLDLLRMWHEKIEAWTLEQAGIKLE